MLKKFWTERFFNWTPQDVADWEKIREKGFSRFILRYGMMLSGAILIIIVGGMVMLLAWNKSHTSLTPELSVMGMIGAICLIGGLVNGLITWTVEEKMYRKFKKIHKPEGESDEC